MKEVGEEPKQNEGGGDLRSKMEIRSKTNVVRTCGESSILYDVAYMLCMLLLPPYPSGSTSLEELSRDPLG
jgi:hypothetical protein